MNIRKKIYSILIVTTWLLASRSIVFAGTDFEYPELVVTPRASDRLEMEAKREDSKRWIIQIPIQVSSLATLTAAVIQSGSTGGKADSKTASLVGIGVGGGWVATTILLSAFYSPYSQGLLEINGLPRKTQREQLTRERLAEEAIQSPARLYTRLKWLSIATNFGASILLVSQAESKSLSQVAAGVSAAVSFVPLIFNHPWQHVDYTHQEYKKKIYGPVAGGTLLFDRSTNKMIPGIAFSFMLN